MDVYEQELIPSCHQEGNLGLLSEALIDVAEIYKSKAQYQKGLDTLREARMHILSNEDISTSLKEDMLTDNNNYLKNMQYLLDAVKEQEGYTAALVKAAKRYHFYDRSHNGGGGIGIGGIGISAASACPQKATKRLYIPPDIVFCVSIGLFVYGTFVFIKRQAPEKRIRRGIMAGAVVLPLLYAITLVWGMTHRSSVEQLNAMASLCAIVGSHDTALELYDEARCHILANPLEESILIGDAGIETFTGPSFIYIKLQLDDMVDALAETIHELVQLNAVLGANILVASHYLSLSITYANRGAEELANTYAELAQREMDQLVQRTEEEINSLLLAQQQPPLVGPSKGNESSKSPDQLLRDKTYYEL
jgi:tetratricopeptide (TPR) repeat protein